MKQYEALFIIAPNAASERFDQVTNTISQEIERFNGAIGEVKEIGQRVLEYPIKRQNDGFYYLIEFTAEPKVIHDLRSQFQLNDDILRFLITVK